MLEELNQTLAPRLEGANISWEFVIGPSEQSLQVRGYECPRCELMVEVVHGKSQPWCCQQPMQPISAP
jgi:hypothetical protein